MLLGEAEQYEKETVQDAFRLIADIQNVECPPCGTQSHCPFSNAVVSAVLQGHKDWEVGPESKAISWITQDSQCLLPPGQCPLIVFSVDELRERQQNDPFLSRVLFYVNRGQETLLS